MTAEDKARQWERKADDLEPEIQVLVLQADMLLRSAGEARVKQAHMRAVADVIRAEGLPRMKRLTATLPRAEPQAAEVEQRRSA